MAGRKRTAYFAPTVGRTIERVAIASIAAIAARGSGDSVAISAVAIFVVIAVFEELGRGIFWDGARITVRDLAYKFFAQRAIQHVQHRAGVGSGSKRNRHRRRTSKKVSDQADQRAR